MIMMFIMMFIMVVVDGDDRGDDNNDGGSWRATILEGCSSVKCNWMKLRKLQRLRVRSQSN